MGGPCVPAGDVKGLPQPPLQIQEVPGEVLHPLVDLLDPLAMGRRRAPPGPLRAEAQHPSLRGGQQQLPQKVVPRPRVLGLPQVPVLPGENR